MVENTHSQDSERYFDFRRSIAPPVHMKRDGAALLVIDMQRFQVSPDILPANERAVMSYFVDRVSTKVIPTIKQLLRYFRQHDMRVIYVTQGSHSRDYRDLNERTRQGIRSLEATGGIKDLLWTGAPHFAILEEIGPEGSEVTINKTTLGAFNGSNIEEHLIETGTKTLIITGVSTNGCVETTARDAGDRGYACVLVDEGTADYDAEAHDATLRAFHYNFGRVLGSAADVIAALDQERLV